MVRFIAFGLQLTEIQLFQVRYCWQFPRSGVKRRSPSIKRNHIHQSHLLMSPEVQSATLLPIDRVLECDLLCGCAREPGPFQCYSTSVPAGGVAQYTSRHNVPCSSTKPEHHCIACVGRHGCRPFERQSCDRTFQHAIRSDRYIASGYTAVRQVF